MGRSAFRLSARTVDVLLMLAVILVLSTIVTADQASPGSVDPLAYLWAVGLGLLMLIRRAMPVLVLTLTVLGYFTYYMAGLPAIGVAVPIAGAVYSAAEAGRVRAAVTASAVVIVASTAFRLLVGQSAAYVVGYELVGHAALVAAVIALGYSIRARRELQLRIDQVGRLASRQTSLGAERRLRDERLRLARELHDSMGHSLSVASLYASVAHEARTDDARDDALRQVGRAVGDSLGQLRSTVSLLRESTSGAVDAPRIADVPDLLDAAATAGYDVRLTWPEVDVSAAVGAAVFRVVQEAVTNTLRHSDGDRIEVMLRADGPDRLLVMVGDNGTRARHPRLRFGHGLAGMRERVEAVGGTLDVSATSDGWRVTAGLPREETS